MPEQTSSPSSESHAAEAGADRTARDLRERAARLQAKVSDLSKTLDQVEQSLSEAAGETKE